MNYSLNAPEIFLLSYLWSLGHVLKPERGVTIAALQFAMGVRTAQPIESAVRYLEAEKLVGWSNDDKVFLTLEGERLMRDLDRKLVSAGLSPSSIQFGFLMKLDAQIRDHVIALALDALAGEDIACEDEE